MSEGVGALAGLLTRHGMELYKTQIQKPPFSPPAILFPIVWVLLYALMGIGAARIWGAARSTERNFCVAIFLLQLAFNFIWSLLFFNAEAFGIAFIWLAVLLVQILWMIVLFSKVDRAAALLQIPYFLWVLFAGYLNYGVWILNR